MAVRIQNGREGAFAVVARAIEIAREIKAWRGLKINFADRIALSLDGFEFLGIKAREFGHRPKAAAYQDLLAYCVGAFVPLSGIRHFRERPRRVQSDYGFVA